MLRLAAGIFSIPAFSSGAVDFFANANGKGTDDMLHECPLHLPDRPDDQSTVRRARVGTWYRLHHTCACPHDRAPTMSHSRPTQK